ncbi:FtsX-like permease family protein [Anaplasmataceae bacterium AB001_6]|nr:FtsX-like permease family protein [Anaplasmataceae bacterium AB001_6]
MLKNFELLLALHYLRMKGAQGFLAFTSLVGIAIGTAVLIVVLAVMHGISNEIQNIFINISGQIKMDSYEHKMEDYNDIKSELNKIDTIKYSIPYIEGQAIISSDARHPRGAIIKGINIQEFQNLSEKLIDFKEELLENGIILGYDMASLLGVDVEDKVNIISPVMIQTPSGIFPTMKQLIVAGFFDANVKDINENYAYINLRNAQILFKEKENVTDGIEIFLYENDDIAKTQTKLISMFDHLVISNWFERHKSFCRAMALERQLMKIVLFMIILISIFNVFSCIVIMIREKMKDIAILRAFGAKRSSIFIIFMLCGVILHIVGFSIGVLLGLCVAVNVNSIVAFVSNRFGFKIIDIKIYDLEQIPILIKTDDIMIIGIYSFLLTIIFLTFPVYKSTRIEPAKVLRG